MVPHRLPAPAISLILILTGPAMTRAAAPTDLPPYRGEIEGGVPRNAKAKTTPDEKNPSLDARGSASRETDDPASSFVTITRLPDDDPDADNPAELQTFRLPPDIETVKIRTGPDGVVATGGEDDADDSPAEKLVYSNTQGTFVLTLPADKIVADDLTTLTPGGCTLRGYSFQVIGKANPTLPGGSYSIEYGLYDNCPQAGGPVPMIPGTGGILIAHDDSRVIEVNFAPLPGITVELPPTVWLGVKPDRSNVGVVGGAPARVGFSQDVVDFPGSACVADAGGFPNNPHASFTAQLFVDTKCASTYPAYQNLQPARSGFNLGSRWCFADDVQLNVADCKLIAYDVGVRMPALVIHGGVQLRLFRDAGGLPGSEIPGTFAARTFNTGPGSYRFRVTLSNAISLQTNRIWVAYESAEAGAGWILTRKDASIGSTERTYARSISRGRCLTMVTNPDWELAPPPDPNAHVGFDVTLHCAGDPPLGACCDMYVTDDGVCGSETKRCVGGEYDGDVCYEDIDCKGDPRCADLPQMNCTFPPRGSGYLPEWQSGELCRECYGLGTPCDTDEDCSDGFCRNLQPFGYETPCGLAACCVAGTAECKNLTEKECKRQPPAYSILGRQWQIGRFCERNAQKCPTFACQYPNPEPCEVGHPMYCEAGPFADHPCEGPEDCVWPCAKVCVGNNEGRYCHSDFDCGPAGHCRRQCMGGPFAGESCTQWDDCLTSGVCVAREQSVCEGGENDGAPCAEHRDCPLGGCSNKACMGGARDGLGCERDFDCRAGICRGLPGCDNTNCCLEVCTNDPSPFAASCCTVNWTDECAALLPKHEGENHCRTEPDPVNKTCPYALELLPHQPLRAQIYSTNWSSWTWFCCAKEGTGLWIKRVIWYRFVATEVSARVSFCEVDGLGTGIAVQVFSVGDNVNPHRSCKSLRPIACNNDSTYCGNDRDASVCVGNLKPGNEYYVAIAVGNGGFFDVTLEPGCDEPSRGCPDRPEPKPTAQGSTTRTGR